jgi:hypothetical protein
LIEAVIPTPSTSAHNYLVPVAREA